jgi:hypothetical protein
MARCKICRGKFEPKYFLQKACIKPKCLAEWARLERELKADKVHAIKRKSFRLSDTNHQHDLTQAVYNRLRVLQEKKWFADRGLEPECISCKKTNMDWCCGHLKTRGSQGNIRYEENNTKLQCNRYCNKGLSGNINGNKTTRGYLQGLADRFGEDRAQEIIDFCETSTAVRKWTGQELQQMRKEFNLQIKRFSDV